MKKIFTLLLVMLAALSVACAPESKKVEKDDPLGIPLSAVKYNSLPILLRLSAL